jgi:RNA-directed DNA polymerase
MAANPESESPSVCHRLMEEVCERENLKQALKRVKANKGAPGVDGMTVQALPAYLREHWPPIRATLLSGTYKPQPVRLRLEEVPSVVPQRNGDSASSTRPYPTRTLLPRCARSAVIARCVSSRTTAVCVSRINGHD